MITYTYVLLITLLIISCSQTKQQVPKFSFNHWVLNQNILDYQISPKHSLDKSGFMFSDQGAWFRYSLSKLERYICNKKVDIKQELVFFSGHTALQQTTVYNRGEHSIEFGSRFQGAISDIGIQLSKKNNTIKLISETSSAIGLFNQF